MKKAIIFDLDGTLVRFPINYEKIFKKLSEIFHTDNDFKPLIPSIVKFSEDNPDLLQESFDFICSEEVLASENFEIISNAVEILNYFKDNNCKLGLVTMQCKKAAESTLSQMGVFELFSSIITRDQYYDRAQQIAATIENLDVESTDALMIGDRIHDFNSAKSVGCDAILFNKNKVDSFKDGIVISELSTLRQNLV